MRIFELFQHQWRVRFSKPSTLLSLLLFAIALIYGATSGRIERDIRSAAIMSHQADIAASMDKWLHDLKALEEKGPASGVAAWFGSAMDVKFSSYMSQASLSDFAIGQSDLLPYLGTISLWEPDIRLFSKYEFDDPVALRLGGFDLSKAVIFLLPLLLIVLTFDVLSSEKDENRLGFCLAQGASIRRIFWLRLLFGACMTFGVTLLISLWALIQNTGEQSVLIRLPFYCLWLFSVFCYGGFWVSVIAVIGSQNKTGAINMLILLLVWSGATLIIPASITAVTETIYPTPSRIAYLAETREVENETQLEKTDIANQFILEHPGLSISESSKIPDYVRTAFFITSTVDEATRPILSQFESTAIARNKMLGAFSYLSPSIIAHQVFNDITGSSSARLHRYMVEARNVKRIFADQVGPHIVAGRRLPVKEVANLPKFEFRPDSLPNILLRNIKALSFMLLATLFLMILTDRRLRRIKGPYD